MRWSASFKARLGTTSVVAAFGIAILFPKLRDWADLNIVLWLLYVLAAGIAIGGGEKTIPSRDRFLIAVVPGLCFIAYAVFRAHVMGQTVALSGIMSDNPRFWVILVVLALLTWGFAYLFSYSRSAVKWAVEYLGGAGRDDIDKISRAVTALIGLIGVLVLLAGALGITKHAGPEKTSTPAPSGQPTKPARP